MLGIIYRLKLYLIFKFSLAQKDAIMKNFHIFNFIKMACFDIFHIVLAYVDNVTLYETLCISKDLNRITKQTQLYRELNKFHTTKTKVKFLTAVEYGNLYLAKWLYRPRHDIYAFHISCRYGPIEVSKWIYSLNHIEVSRYNDSTLLFSCKNNYSEFAKSLYNPYNDTMEDVLDNNYSCKWHIPININIDIIEWLFTLPKK